MSYWESPDISYESCNSLYMYYFYRSDKFILNSDSQMFCRIKRKLYLKILKCHNYILLLYSVTGWPKIVKSHASSSYKMSAIAVPMINIDKKATCVFLHLSVLNEKN